MGKRCFALLGAISACLALISCSTAPKGPAPGTPAFYWAAARETWAAGDYTKTLEHLDNVLVTDNEYTARALPWFLVLSSGYVSGYVDLAENYDRGARANKQNALPFRRAVSVNQTLAGKMALRFVDTWSKASGKLPEGDVALEFSQPRGSIAPVAALGKVEKGTLLTAAEAQTAQARAIERGVLLAACRAAGAPNDPARTEQVLASGKVPRATFMLAAAGMLYDQSQLYTSDKLGDPQKMTIFCERAQTALQGVPDSQENKDLKMKIGMALKKVKRPS